MVRCLAFTGVLPVAKSDAAFDRSQHENVMVSRPTGPCALQGRQPRNVGQEWGKREPSSTTKLASDCLEGGEGDAQRDAALPNRVN